MGTLTEQSVLGVIRAARPIFRNSHDKLAFAIHASFVASGFLVHAAGPAAFTDDALSASSTEEVGIDNWNQLEDHYGFVYSNPEKGSKKIVLKCLCMNGKLLVDAFREGDSEPSHLEIDVGDYVPENEGSNYNFKNFKKLVGVVEKELVSKYSSSPANQENLKSRSKLVEGPKDYDKPSFEIPDSDYPSSSQPIPGYVVPPIPGVGGSDLFPGPGIGMYPTRGGFGGSGGMLVGPHDPRFGFDQGFGMPGVTPGNVPPGARFDPYGPPGVPGFEPGRFTRNPRQPHGGTHPDLEHFRDGSDFI